MKSLYLSNRLTSPQFSIQTQILFPQVVSSEVWRLHFFFLLFWVSRVSRCWFPFVCVWFLITTVYRSTVETLIAAKCSSFSVGLDTSMPHSRLSKTLLTWTFPVGGDLLLLQRHIGHRKTGVAKWEICTVLVLQVCTSTATFLWRWYNTLLAILNRSSMSFFQVRFSETWMPRSFTAFELSCFWSLILKIRSLRLEVIFVQLSIENSILFFLTHSSNLSRSSCVSHYDFLIESTLKLSAKINGTKKLPVDCL